MAIDPEEKEARERQRRKRSGKHPYIEWFPEAKPKGAGRKNATGIGGLAEALSVKNRRKLAQRMIRQARKMAVARKKARAKFAPDKNLKIRAQKLTRSIFRKRLAGKRGQMYSSGKIGMADKIAIDKMVDKQKPIIKKMVARLMPAVKRAEAQRLASNRVSSDNTGDKRHKKKFHGAKIQK